MVRAVLIEIETPAKRWCTEQGQQTASLTQAIGQLEDWRSWFRQDGRPMEFRDHYRLVHREVFEQRYILVYGTSEGARINARFERNRRNLETGDQTVMSFNRLVPDYHQADFVTVRRRKTNAADGPFFELVGLPATFQFSAMSPRLCCNVAMNRAALDRADFMSDERRDFIEAHWEEMAKKGREYDDVLKWPFGRPL